MNNRPESALSAQSIEPILPKLFVGGFPLEITELDLAKLIALYGDIATLKIVRDKKTRRCKGYAFVEMLSEEGAQAVIKALDGRQLSDRILTVNLVLAPSLATSPTPIINAWNDGDFASKSTVPHRSQTAALPLRPRRPRRAQ